MRLAIYFAVFYTSLLLNFNASAQQEANAPKSLLWQISGNGLSKPSYMFGTIHMICKQDYVWSASMGNALNSTDKVCLEMDMDNPKMITQIAAAMVDESGKKLKDYFAPDDYQLLKRFLKDSMGLSIIFFEKVKPFALESLLSTQCAPCKDQMSYEDNIVKLAQKGNKEVLGLEALEEQLAVFESIPTDSVVKQIMDQVLNKKRNDSEYKALISSYRHQNIEELYTQITNTQTFGTDLNSFLFDRNKKWIPRMKAKMDHNTIFFAVGAGHLWGDNGVINLLRKEGYTVTPVTEKPVSKDSSKQKQNKSH